MTSRQEQWALLRRQLWQPPRPHGEQPRERVVGPLELFYDLVVVVLVAQAAHHLAGELDWRGLGLFAAVFALVWIAWLNGSLHHELHGHEDARGRSMFLLQILVLVPLGAFIPGAGGEHGAAFAVDAGVLLAVLALLWLLASRSDTPEFRRPSKLFVTGTAVCAVVLAASAALPADARVVHLLGERAETRHLVIADRQAVISPSWSLHAGVGTAAYSFVWAMAGENQAFDDMDPAPVTDLL